MFIKAVYADTKQDCYVNTDYVLDIFKRTDGNYDFFTFDNERGAYIIDENEFNKALNKLNNS